MDTLKNKLIAIKEKIEANTDELWMDNLEDKIYVVITEDLKPSNYLKDSDNLYNGWLEDLNKLIEEL